MSTLVEIHLVDHSPSAIQNLEKSTERIEEVLDQTSGKVYVFLEDTYLPTSTATNIEQLIDRGVRPSLAYYIGDSILATIPETSEAVDILRRGSYQIDNAAMKSFIKDLEDEYKEAELIALDSIFLKYRPRNTKTSRMGVLFESTADQTKDFNEPFQENEAEIYKLMHDGNLSAAMELFQRNVRYMAGISLIREELVAEKVMNYLGEDVSAIFIRFGTNHTGIYHRLRKMGLDNVSRVFLDQDDTIDFHFDPGAAAIRKIMNKGFDALSEIEWYRALIGETTLHLLKAISREVGQEVKDQYAIQVAHNTARTIDTMQEIEELRSRIKRDGIVMAFTNI